MKKIWEKGGATTAPNAGNPAARAQSADGALGGSSMPSSEKVVTIGKKSRRMLKIFAAGGLAFFMGVGTLLGVLVAPVANSANAQLGASTLTPQEQLLNGAGLGLDPQNDPVVYTTDWGLEIKYANALSNSNLAGYTYFTMGKYNNYDINWVIIGYDPSMADFVGEYSGDTYQRNPIQGDNTVLSTIDDSPAGTAILKENFVISSLAKSNEEIGDGCVLCLSELILDYVAFENESNVSTNYNSSNNILKDFHQELYDSSLMLTQNQQSKIVSQSFKNIYYQSSTSYSENVKMFPLAARGEKFDIAFYLTEDIERSTKGLQQTVSEYRYWLRSGSARRSFEVYYVLNSGTIADDATAWNEFGVRPAFVLEI